MSCFEVSPNASALVLSMRSIGYSFNNAIADIIDNSITAGASRIEIICDWVEDEPYVEITDNGIGMDHDELVEAMRAGSKSPADSREKNDLGRFGLGLKTASFSQCKKLSVKTRKNDVTYLAQWDLDRVVKENKWLLDLSELDFEEGLRKSGTIVRWECIDSLEKKQKDSKTYFNEVVVNLIDHVSLIFHRFMDGSYKNIDIFINGNKCIGFDPFFKEKSDHAPEEVIDNCIVRSYSLPHHSKISKKEWDQYAGKEGYFLNQGFYLYRNGRLILKGTWFGLTKRADNIKLCRVSLDIDNSCDLSWQIDVKKSRANPPLHIRKRLRELIATLIRPSKRKITNRARALTNSDIDPTWIRLSDNGSIKYQINRNHPCIKRYSENLEEKDLIGFLGTLNLIDAMIPIPSIYSDYSEDAASLITEELTIEDLYSQAKEMYLFYESKNRNRDTILNLIRSSEPFTSRWYELEKLL